MINTWHFLRIVPLSAASGISCMSMLQAGDREPEWYDDDHDVSGLLEED